MKQKGEITVFLVLMLSVLSGFILTLARSVKICISKSEAAYVADNAVKSCFAEYNRELFKRFHILLIDSSYKTADHGRNRIADHFSSYMENSMGRDKLCHAGISECRSAGEGNGQYIYDCAIRYAKENLNTDPGLHISGEKAQFLTYLLYVCGNDDIPREGSVRRGETEYLLYGLSSDDENVRWAHLDHMETTESSYEEYLIRRLEKEDTDVLIQRFSILVTEYMRENGSPGFDLNECYYDITFSATVKSDAMKEYNLTRRYEYEPEGI
ncbi:MAG: hypothetical protein K6E49_09815 [Lachnospiraceae bacterium]|nr:hypothetical protein [Lachnospiraceae bacterium]